MHTPVGRRWLRRRAAHSRHCRQRLQRHRHRGLAMTSQGFKSQEFPSGNGGTAPLRFKLKRFDQISLSTTPNYLIKGSMPRSGLVVIWGPPKCGKSFVAFDMAMHIAEAGVSRSPTGSTRPGRNKARPARDPQAGSDRRPRRRRYPKNRLLLASLRCCGRWQFDRVGGGRFQGRPRTSEASRFPLRLPRL